MKKNGIGFFLGGRLIKLAALMLAAAIITFLLMELSPIDPVTAYVGASTKVGAEQRELIAEKWGLNKTPTERFFAWLGNILRGDFGDSLIYRKSVLAVVGQKFLASLALMAISWLGSGLLGFALGLIAGSNEGKWSDKLIRVWCSLLISTPTFWLGILFIMLFAVWLKLLPVGLSVPIGVLSEAVGWGERIRHLILPALTLTVVSVAPIALHTREKTLELLQTDYVLFAIANGESRKSIIVRHVLRGALLPAVTLQFMSFSELFGGAVFVEQVFSYPGLGYATVQAGLRGDMPLLLGITLISLIFVFTGNTLADLSYRLIDPRLRNGGLV